MIIWIASYPKSGNTWIRSIVASLMYSDSGIFDFNILRQVKQFPSKEYFNGLTNDYENIHELKKHWITAQEKINLNDDITFLKTHHLNCKIGNHKFTNQENTAGTIYVVRDPRNIITSLANFLSIKSTDSKNLLFDQSQLMGDKKLGWGENIRSLIGTWSENYKSWTVANDNLLLIKYENLIESPLTEIRRIITFIKRFKKIEISDEKINSVLKSTSFNNLKKLEEDGGFIENSVNKDTREKVKFFNLGKDNSWEKLLDGKIVKEIEERLFNEMSELGYLKK